MTAHVVPGSSHIVATRNRPGLLADAVASILASDSLPAELIIIDQSDRPHPQLVNASATPGIDVRYFWRPGIGLSRARNEGIDRAHNELLSFTDDDMLVPPSWYGSLSDALARSDPRSVITGPVLAARPERPGAFAPSTSSGVSRRTYMGRVPDDVLFAGNMAIRRAAFREVGPFDERLGLGARFPAAEDNDFAYRLLQAGYRIMSEPDAFVFHRAWRDRRTYLPLRWRYGRGQGGYLAKHLSRTDSFMLRRLVRTTWSHLAGIHSLRQDSMKAVGNVIFAIGVLTAAFEWLLTQRGKP